jgi:hypothetical protein
MWRMDYAGPKPGWKALSGNAANNEWFGAMDIAQVQPCVSYPTRQIRFFPLERIRDGPKPGPSRFSFAAKEIRLQQTPAETQTSFCMLF